LFTSLRARGCKITDIAVIVIAADDGVMKQTVEAINHAKDAKVPIIVAITKIDKPVDNSEFIKTQLAEHGLMAEDWGGDVPIVKVSSVTGQGIEDLMDQILLHAEVSELVCNPDRNGIGVVLEAHKDIQK
jgi:translation initiation factor IF-2